jgi:hypothetical protein
MTNFLKILSFQHPNKNRGTLTSHQKRSLEKERCKPTYGAGKGKGGDPSQRRH